MRSDRDWLPDVIANPLATVVPPGDYQMSACHIPVAIIQDANNRIAIGHVSRDDPVWNAWHPDSSKTRLVFTGPNAYVSPRTYQDAIQVPTWNYVAVHLIGNPVPVHFDENPSGLHQIMDALIARFEPEYLPVWHTIDLVNQEKLMRGIVGFRMQIIEVECVEKLSQNRTQRDAEAISAVLDSTGQQALAARMIEVRK